jgi:hypothetical protein
LGTLVTSVPCVGGATGLPMQGEGKAAGGRAAASHVSCCVFCVVVFCAGPYFWLTDMWKLDLRPAKMADFYAIKT